MSFICFKGQNQNAVFVNVWNTSYETKAHSDKKGASEDVEATPLSGITVLYYILSEEEYDFNVEYLGEGL